MACQQGIERYCGKALIGLDPRELALGPVFAETLVAGVDNDLSESYSQVRREMAKKIGLGRKRGTKLAPKAKAAPSKPAPKPRGRPRKVLN